MKKLSIFGIIVATLLSIVALGVAISKNEPAAPVQAEQLKGESNLDLLNLNQIGVNGVSDFSLEGSMVAGTSTDFWINNTGVTVFVYDLSVFTDGTASSTYKFFAEASTSPIALIELTTLSTPSWENAIINGVLIPTSTAATSTSHLWDVGVNNRKHPVGIKAGQRLNLHLQNAGGTATFTAVQTDCTSTGKCESATSTNRGFNVVWMAKLFSTSTAEFPTDSGRLRPFSQQ